MSRTRGSRLARPIPARRDPAPAASRQGRSPLGREELLAAHADEEAARYAAARERGDFDVAGVFAGEGVELIREVLPAATIVERVVDEATRLLRRATSLGEAG